MRLLRGASWEGGWKLGEWKLRLSAEAAVARPSRSIARPLGTWVHERNNDGMAVPNHLILSRARAPQRAELPCIMLRHTRSVDGCHIVIDPEAFSKMRLYELVPSCLSLRLTLYRLAPLSPRL